MIRRVVALLTWLLMANLTLVGREPVCATTHSTHAAGMHHGHMDHEAVHTTSNQAGSDSTPCGTPSLPMCCQALTSCSMVFSAPDARAGNVPHQLSASILVSVSRLPLSEIVAPDPPPPRV